MMTRNVRVVLREAAELPQEAWPGTGAQPLAYLAG